MNSLLISNDFGVNRVIPSYQCKISDFKACKIDLFRRGNLKGDPVHTLTNKSIGDNMKHRIKRGPKIKSVSNGKGTWAVYW